MENILKVSKDTNEVKIVDFGIAGLFSGRKSEVTKAGSILYLPPEIFLTKNVAASPALDIWALGCILYALIVGELPFKGNNEKEIIQ